MQVQRIEIPARRRVQTMRAVSHQLDAARRVRGPLRLARVIASCLAVAAASVLTGGGPAGIASAGASTYVGTSFSTYLPADQYIGNNGYRFIMQWDGNLVLYNGYGRACWASNTSGRSGVYAKYSGDYVLPGPTYLSLFDPPATTDLRRWYGEWGRLPHLPTNVSLNSRGEVWIAYKKFVSC